MAGQYRSLTYYGGKRGYGQGDWIAGLLPWYKVSCYVEPFAGMAGVLLAREPVKIELLNDLNGRVVNWWRAVRDDAAEFGRLVEYTPRSREEYAWARGAVDDLGETPLRRALAFHILLDQGLLQGDGLDGGWARKFNPYIRNIPRHDQRGIEILADRLRAVQLENCDALALLERTAGIPEAVIYADPPYPSADTSPYALGDLDYKRLGELLQAQEGAVAVSGYPGEWDSLGWECERKSAHRNQIGGSWSPRVECLWRNERCVAMAATQRLL